MVKESPCKQVMCYNTTDNQFDITNRKSASDLWGLYHTTVAYLLPKELDESHSDTKLMVDADYLHAVVKSLTEIDPPRNYTNIVSLNKAADNIKS